MSEYEAGRVKVIVDTFQYGSGMTLDELIEIHYPSKTFPDKHSIEVACNNAVLEGKLTVDARGRYRKSN